MTWHERFNHSGFSRFINSLSGRVFRIAAGLGFLGVGYVFRAHPLGVVSMVWSIFPLSAGGFDVCYISAALGGAAFRGADPGAVCGTRRPSEHMKLAARSLRGRIAFVHPYSCVEPVIIGAPGWVGRRSLPANR